jgi:hypothetical protein
MTIFPCANWFQLWPVGQSCVRSGRGTHGFVKYGFDPVRRNPVHAAVAVSIIGHHKSFGSFTLSWIDRGSFAIAGKRTEHSRISGPISQLLVVVLPDGKIVIPRVMDKL